MFGIFGTLSKAYSVLKPVGELLEKAAPFIGTFLSKFLTKAKPEDLKNKNKALVVAIETLLTFLPEESIEGLVKTVIEMAEKQIVDSDNKIDDILLPLLKKLKEDYGIK